MGHQIARRSQLMKLSSGIPLPVALIAAILCTFLIVNIASAQLPSPWQDADIGSPALAGSAT
jgi:hypothetical protein